MSDLQKEVGQDKKYTIEDITLATTVGDVLHAYRQVSVEFRSYAELVQLQTAVADKMHKLGDEDKSYSFTLLASETRNTDRNANTVRVFEEVVDGFKMKVNRFDESTESLGSHLDRVVSTLSDTSDNIVRAASLMDQASSRIGDNFSK